MVHRIEEILVQVLREEEDVVMEPRLIHMEPGGWLAVTGADAPVPVGVFGQSKREALDTLAAALRERDELHLCSADDE
jgi:hypothetical protein